ncbi:MAG: hypothetical protein AB1650_01450 [Candidatus Omnitrophota bacterium]
MKKSIFVALAAIIAFCMCSRESLALARDEYEPAAVVYITGIGCSNCAATDPQLLVQATAANPGLVIFEYEIFHSKHLNKEVSDQYFKNYAGEGHSGVPFLIFNHEKKSIGRFKVMDAIRDLKEIRSNDFPGWDGVSVDFDELDLTRLPGAPNIWTKNRVLIHGKGGDNSLLKKILLSHDLPGVLNEIEYTSVKPEPVAISRGEINFTYAVKIGSWRLQWNGEAPAVEQKKTAEKSITLLIAALFILIIAFSFFNVKVRKVKKGAPLTIEFQGRWRDLVIVSVSLAALIVFFMSARNIPPGFLERAGYDMPLPLFTFLVGLADGFNPCNMFVLTCLMALLISTSESRKRLYIVGLSFIAMVYLFYFLFMALWLNVFKYISFVTPLRITIGLIAVIAGAINCKELFFFKKGISLTIPEKQKGPLMQRIERMKEVVRLGSMPLLISSSLGLAILSSLVELPCTAGFPIIYTGILSGRGLENSFSYYLYLMYYNLIYVLPLGVIVFLFIYTLKARHITQRQMEVIKFIGGIIMLLLGIALLVNPGLLGLQG